MLSVLPKQKPEETLIGEIIVIGQIVNGHGVHNQHLAEALVFQCLQDTFDSLFSHCKYP